MVANSASHIEQLRQKYPIRNSPLSPDICVYEQSNGPLGKVIYWELNNVHLQIWANALVNTDCCF
jgi:hypothetical protein